MVVKTMQILLIQKIFRKKILTKQLVVTTNNVFIGEVEEMLLERFVGIYSHANTKRVQANQFELDEEYRRYWSAASELSNCISMRVSR